VASVLRVGRKDGIKGGCKVFFCRDLEFPFFFSLLDRECRQRPRPFSMSVLQIFGRLVGSAAGHFRDFFFTGSVRCRRANGRVVNIGGDK
jgi:hypothetical protein